MTAVMDRPRIGVLSAEKKERLPLLGRSAEIALATILGAACVGSRLLGLDRYTGSYPEGIRAEQLLLMAAGYRPFRDIFSDQGPWLLQTLYPGYVLFSGTLVGVRAGIVVGSLIGLAGVYWIARQIAGPVAALVSLVLLGLSPIYLQFSRLAVAEVLALAPAIISVGCALRFARCRAVRWLYAAAACLAFSILIKPITLGTALPVALAIWSAGGSRWRNMLKTGLITAGIGLGGVILAGLPEILQQIVGFRMASRTAEGWSLATNLARLRLELTREGMGLLVLASLGAILAVRRREAWPLLAWLLATGLTLLLHAPLHTKHFAILVVPVVALAGYGCAQALRSEGASRSRAGLLGVLGLGLTLWLSGLPSILARDWLLLTSDDLFERDEARLWYDDAAETLRRVVGQNEFLLTDHAYLAYAAGRMVPPGLVEASATRVRAGSLTDRLAIDITHQYDTRAVLLWADKLAGLRRFRGWLTESYVPAKTWAAGETRPVLWLRTGDRLAADRSALRSELKPALTNDSLGGWRVISFGLDRFGVRAGEAVSATLEWEAATRDGPNVSVALSLHHADGRQLTEEQAPLLRGLERPAWLFWVGSLRVPPGAPAGDYLVSATLWDSRRQPLASPVQLGTLRVDQ